MSDVWQPWRAVAASELKQLDAAFHFLDHANEPVVREQGVTIPALEEVLEQFRDARFILDNRRDDTQHIKNVISVVERLEAAACVFIVSESDRVIEVCRAVHPVWCYGAPTNEAKMVIFGSQPPVSPIFLIPEAHDDIQVLSSSILERLHERGRKIWVWTIDAVDDVERLRQLGVDGVFTNYPGRMVRRVGST